MTVQTRQKEQRRFSRSDQNPQQGVQNGNEEQGQHNKQNQQSPSPGPATNNPLTTTREVPQNLYDHPAVRNLRIINEQFQDIHRRISNHGSDARTPTLALAFLQSCKLLEKAFQYDGIILNIDQAREFKAEFELDMMMALEVLRHWEIPLTRLDLEREVREEDDFRGLNEVLARYKRLATSKQQQQMSSSSRSSSPSPSPPLASPEERIAACIKEIESQSDFITSQPKPSPLKERKQPSTENFQGISSTEIAAAAILAECIQIIKIVSKNKDDEYLEQDGRLAELKASVKVHMLVAVREKRKLERAIEVPLREAEDDFLGLRELVERHNRACGELAKGGSELRYSPKKIYRWEK
ncbi:hypothetical protein EJ08DRAFT_699786 [Tothia fuscella]|uniref:Uncharacterized protein n=1 Tax=Tothia fuscella TaxID=1048955 RepID=A0A9P4TW67_9PEZI|nr:hypothetical protein EJ08DRAFT_699786 [Tothia fuscella]